MADQPHSRPIHRHMARCVICKAWWSVAESANNGVIAVSCPCGGSLALVDMDAHMKSLPVAVPPLLKESDKPKP